MRTYSRTQGGAAIAELVVVLPALLMLGLGVLQSALFYQAKTTVTYATFEAARKGAVTHAQRAPMLDEFGLRLAPVFGGDGSAEKAQRAINEGRKEALNPTLTRIAVLNPTRQAFADFGVRNSKNGKLEIPNTHLRYRDSEAIGADSRVNVQDANLLKIKTTYGFELKVPLINGAITTLLSQFDAGNAHYYAQGRIPITAVATVRMQSEAWEDGNWNADGTDPGNGNIPNGDLADHTPTAGDTDGDGIPDSEDGDIDGDGIANEFDADANGNGQPDIEENDDGEVEEIECETATVDEDTQGASGNDDAGFWGELWTGVKDGLKEGYEFIKGFWAGMREQIGDLIDAITSPVETVKGLIALGQALIDDFEGTVRQIGEVLGKDFTNLTQCGSYDRGRVIGEYASPAFVLKLATKLSKFGDLATAIRKTKDDFGCASFVRNTRVATVGGLLAINSLMIGDSVLTRDESTYQNTEQQVVDTVARDADRFYELRTEYETLQVTGEHPIWVQGKGWTPASDIEASNVLAAQRGDVLVLSNTLVEQDIEVFNFTVANTQSYFVGERLIWVHNAPSCELPDDFFDRPLTERTLAKSNGTHRNGLIGEGKANQLLEERGFIALGDTNVDPKKLNDKDSFEQTLLGYRGVQGIDSIFRDPESGTIYIVESKASGVSEGCPSNRLCKLAGGERQMSREWLNRERLEDAGLSEDEIRETLSGLRTGDTVRLYAGTSKVGVTEFYEIRDATSPDGRIDRKNVIVDFGNSVFKSGGRAQ